MITGEIIFRGQGYILPNLGGLSMLSVSLPKVIIKGGGKLKMVD